MMLRRLAVQTSRRGFATRRKLNPKPLPKEILDALPVYPEDTPGPSWDPEFTRSFPNNPVTSAHMIDVEKQAISTLDSVAVSPDGKVIHGRYGDLGDAAAAIPLEYLALLTPAAEGAAGLRVISEKTHGKTGTLLVYGASLANGLATAQLADAAGHAVVAVVSGEHSGDEDFMEILKGMMSEPGTAICQEYALSKKLFADLVNGIAKGDEGIKNYSADEYLEDFKKLFIDYSEFYPDTRPAAVSEDHVVFKSIYREKDKEFWEDNMRGYLSQFPPGAPKPDPAKLDAYFSTEQYELFRQKFWDQTTKVISGSDDPFSPPHIVKKMCEETEKPDHKTYPGAGPYFPYSFSVLNQKFPVGTELKAGGPILGAVICVTPDVKAVAEKIAKAKTLREKGEALAFMSQNQKAAYGACRSVIANATKVGAPVVAIGGSLPGLETVKSTEADVKEALAAMDIDENGKTRLNYYIQAYRANNFPFYENYGIHRAMEPLAGPRQFIVTK